MISENLDTAGYVIVLEPRNGEFIAHETRWPDLSPVMQGYLDGLGAWCRHNLGIRLRLDMISGASLQRVMTECVKYEESSLFALLGVSPNEKVGRTFFDLRQRGVLRDFDPVSPRLDAGVVYLG